jgi:hypothetical protein
LEKIARSTKFVQRSSPVTADKFLDVLFKDASCEHGMSLLNHSSELHTAHHTSVTPQAMDGRFNDYAVKFMRTLVNELFCRQVSSPVDESFLKRYNFVRIWDSSRIELPACMQDDFPGFGGGASSAGISIQYRYDLKNGIGCSMDVYPATYSDAKYTEEVSIDENSLEVFDLGYVSHDFLKRLQDGKSHYVCRLHSQSKVYDLDENEIDLKKIYRWMRLYRIPVYRKEVLAGDKRLPSQLVINLVDEQTCQKRLAKAKKDSHKKGWQMSDQFKVRMRMNLMLTNTDAQEIPDAQVYLLYKFRWQIELFFKSWKSAGWHLDKIKEVKYERYMCVLYAKLLMIILSDQIHRCIARERYRQDKKLLSPQKCVKTLRGQINLLRQLINAGVHKIYEILDKISQVFSRGHILCQRKKRINYAELFDLFICKTEEL